MGEAFPSKLAEVWPRGSYTGNEKVVVEKYSNSDFSASNVRFQNLSSFKKFKYGGNLFKVKNKNNRLMYLKFSIKILEEAK